MDASWAAVLETHTAALFFAGDLVFKLRKPVRLDFIDLTDAEARRRACEAEVKLNRRLAPDVYLGVADVTIGDRLVDRGVVMRRLPSESALAARVANGGPDLVRMVEAVADALAAFHAACPVVGGELSRETWQPPIQQFRTEIERAGRLRTVAMERSVLDRIDVLAEEYAAGRGALFAQRLAAGLIRDGHGDLQASDIYLLPDGPRILDCLEFDERLRIGDVLHDVAFLAMDLEHHGRPDLADVFLDRYVASSGESHPPSLAHFYVGHRALIRAKVTAIRREQTGDHSDTSTEELLQLSLRHLHAAQVRVILMGGLPGAGKTTVSAALADQLPAVHLSSDQIRYELTMPMASGSGFATGRYAPAVTDAVYDELLRRAGAAVSAGEHVILDASWQVDEHRAAARRLAREQHAALVELHVTADDSVAESRLRNRPAAPGGSEATVEVRDRMRVRFNPWPQAIVLDTCSPLNDTLRTAGDAVTAADAVAGWQSKAPTVPVGGHR